MCIRDRLGKKPIKVKVPFVGNHFAMKPDEWQQTLKAQLENYYEPINAPAQGKGASEDVMNTNALPLPDLEALAKAVRDKKPKSS